MDRVSTGIFGLDEMLEGGFPKGRAVLIAGEPGSGKTTFGLQFLMKGVQAGEPGVFVSLDETVEHVEEDMAAYGWNFRAAMKDRKFDFIDMIPTRFIELKLDGVLHLITERVKSLRATRAVVDPITAFLFTEKDEYQRRLHLIRIFETLSSLGCTSLITTTLGARLHDEFSAEEYLSHGVVRMRLTTSATGAVRAMQVPKMRGINHDKAIHPYVFQGGKGLVVYPKEAVL